MTVNIKLIDKSNPIDENTFLDFSLTKIAKLNPSPDFHAAIERLVNIREVLLIARDIDKLQNIGNWTQYMEALKWLRGEVSLRSFMSVPQIADIAFTPEPVISQFNLYTQQLLLAFQGETVYGQIEIALKIAPTLKAAPVAKQVTQAGVRAEKTITDTAAIKTQQINEQTANTENQLRAIAGELQQNFSVQIANERQNATSEIHETLNQAARSLRTAESLNDWGKRYDEDIQELEIKIHGINSDGVFARNISTIINKIAVIHNYGLRNVNWRMKVLKFLCLMFKNLFSFIRLRWSKIYSISSRRTISFLSLSIIAISMVIFPLLSEANIINTDLFSFTGINGWFAKIGLWLPGIGILSVGYSFATKNYRIYNNMLDQYKHRRAVARTAQGIILGVSGTAEEDRELRSAMAAAAASALFEHKTTGHLSKKEVESFGLFDIVRSIGVK